MSTNKELQARVSELETGNAELLETNSRLANENHELNAQLETLRANPGTLGLAIGALIESNGLHEVLDAMGEHIPEDMMALRYALGLSQPRCLVCQKPLTLCKGHSKCEKCNGVDGKHGTVRTKVGIRTYPNGRPVVDPEGKEVDLFKNLPCPNDPGPCHICGAHAGHHHREVPTGERDDDGRQIMTDCPNKAQ
jgi:hypothetical protein